MHLNYRILSIVYHCYCKINSINIRRNLTWMWNNGITNKNISKNKNKTKMWCEINFYWVCRTEQRIQLRFYSLYFMRFTSKCQIVFEYVRSMHLQWKSLIGIHIHIHWNWIGFYVKFRNDLIFDWIFFFPSCLDWFTLAEFFFDPNQIFIKKKFHCQSELPIVQNCKM